MHQRLFLLFAMLVLASPVQPFADSDAGRTGGERGQVVQLTMYSATTLWSIRRDPRDDSYEATGTVLVAYRFDLGNEVEVADSAIETPTSPAVVAAIPPPSN